MKRTIKESNELVVLFGEDKATKPAEFFEMFHNFAREFSNCYKNIMITEKVKLEEEKKQKAFNRSKTMVKPKPPIKGKSKPGPKEASKFKSQNQKSIFRKETIAPKSNKIEE